MKQLYDIVYLASFGRKFIQIAFSSDSADWFSTSQPENDPNLPKLEFGSSHEKFDV